MSKVDARFIKITGTNAFDLSVIPEAGDFKKLTVLDQEFVGVKTFSSVPLLTGTIAVDGSENQVVNKGYVDGKIDAAVLGLSWRDPVDEVVTDGGPSGNEVGNDGFRVLVLGTPTGAFVGQANKVAVWDGSAWSFVAPSANWALISKDSDQAYTYDEDTTTWVMFSSGAMADATRVVKGKVSVSNGLDVSEGALFLNLTADGGLELTGTEGEQSVGVKVDVDGVLNVAAAGLGVTLEESNATLVNSTGTLKVNLSGTGALVSGANGLTVNLETTNPGLQIVANELGLKLDTASAFAVNASGLTLNVGNALNVVDVEGTNTLELKVKAGGGIVVDEDGVSVNSSALTSRKLVVHTLTAGEITAKSFVLDGGVKAADAESIMVIPEGGLPQIYGADFTVTESVVSEGLDTISWTGLGLESITFVEGEKFSVYYTG